ncbi:MAG: lipoprotein [Betaproteobacteria bacterium]|nr:lipoprotein [Betaproteobacteria bacterium]
MRGVLVVLTIVMMVAACGQKGPLYLRDQPPAGVKPQKKDSYQPKPYPEEANKHDVSIDVDKSDPVGQ